MKFLVFLAFTVVAFLAYTAQAQRCPGEPRNPICTGRKDEGHGGRGCAGRDMWWYNPSNRQCLKMKYKGCGGNRNRYCTKDQCQRQCRH